MVVIMYGSAWDGHVCAVSFGVAGPPLYSCAGLAFTGKNQCPECHSRCNTNRTEQGAGCSESLDLFWMGLVKEEL